MERKQNVAAIKRLIQEKRNPASSFSALTRFLIAKGVMRCIAEEISLEFANSLGINHLNEIVAKRLNTIKAWSFENEKGPIAFVGPTGSKKTTAFLRLACMLRQKIGRRICIYTFDTEKEEWMRSMCSKWGVYYFDANSQKNDDLLLIDTPGCQYYLNGRIETLGNQLAEFKELDILLTLSAAQKDVDLFGAIHQFSPLVPKGLVFTKLEETLSPGTLFNVCHKTDLPIRYVLTDDIHIADPYRITHKILAGLNEETFHLLRQMAVVDE